MDVRDDVLSLINGLLKARFLLRRGRYGGIRFDSIRFDRRLHWFFPRKWRRFKAITRRLESLTRSVGHFLFLSLRKEIAFFFFFSYIFFSVTFWRRRRRVRSFIYTDPASQSAVSSPSSSARHRLFAFFLSSLPSFFFLDRIFSFSYFLWFFWLFFFTEFHRGCHRSSAAPPVPPYFLFHWKEKKICFFFCSLLCGIGFVPFELIDWSPIDDCQCVFFSRSKVDSTSNEIDSFTWFHPAFFIESVISFFRSLINLARSSFIVVFAYFLGSHGTLLLFYPSQSNSTLNFALIDWKGFQSRLSWFESSRNQ